MTNTAQQRLLTSFSSIRPIMSSGIAWGLIGVACFSLTLPITRYISADFHPLFIGMGRCVLAGLVALLILCCKRAIIPNIKQLKQLAIVASGVVFGFPILSAVAMQSVPASHGGVIAALLPLGTALVACLITGERPSRRFWLCSSCATTLVLGLALTRSVGGFQIGDWALLASLPLASLGYAYGGLLAKSIPGWQVICWALVLSLPLTLPLALYFSPNDWQQIPAIHWSGFIYLALFSQLFGFFFWNKGLALGGIAKISQLQLLQPFGTLLAASWLLGEAITVTTMVVCLLVVILVMCGRAKAQK